MRSAAQRIAAYDARMQSSQIDPTLTAMNALQMANYAGYVADWYPLQVNLRAWMDALPVAPVNAFIWEACAGEGYAIYRRFSGGSALAQAVTLKAKYVSLGLNGANVSAMMLAVFGWVVP